MLRLANCVCKCYRTGVMRRLLVPAIAAVLLATACTSRSSVQRRYVEAVRAQREGHDREARQAWDRLLEDAPNFEGVRNNLAVLDIEAGTLDKALRLIRQELELHPISRAARINEVLTLLLQNDAALAAKRSRSLLGTLGDDPLAQLLHGLALLRADTDAEAAVAALTKALKADASSIRARAAFARGVLHARAGDWKSAERDFGAASRLRRDAVAHFNRALALLHLDRLKEADDALKLSTALDNRAAAVPHLQAIVLHRDGRADEALEAARRARTLDEKRPGVDLLVGVVHYEARRFEDAARAFSAETKLTPKSNPAWFALALAHMELEQLEASRDAFAEAARLDPSDEAAAHNRDSLTSLLEP